MSLHDIIEERVLEKIKPGKDEYEEIFEKYNYVKQVIESILMKHGVNAEVTLQGSIAHDTWLSGDRDIDVFVLYPKTWSVDKLRSYGFKILLEAAEEIGNYDIRYAEHPYVRIYVDNLAFDVVPGFKIESSDEIRTAVDRTPLHTEYLNRKLNNYLRDQVRLLKKFMKNIGVYGAEIKTKGFSGYAVELLVVVYGSFRNVLREAARWRHPVYINTLDDKELFKRVIRVLKRKYADSVIYMPDPIDPERNVTAAVSLRSLALFSIAAKCYLENPGIEYFFSEDINYYLSKNIDKLLKNRCIILLSIKTDEKLPPETIWGEILRIGDRGYKILEINDFRPIYWSAWTNERDTGYILYEAETCRKDIPKLYQGPEYWFRERVFGFIRKHVLRNSIGPWIDQHGSLKALGIRKYRDIVELLMDKRREYIVTPHFKDKEPSIRIIKSKKDLEIYRQNHELYKWLLQSIIRRRKWMEKCIGENTS
jgi:tRNA nucleotidyltransferase (CCA-adding enzyme)